MSINMNDGRWTHEGCQERHTTNMGRLECELDTTKAEARRLRTALVEAENRIDLGAQPLVQEARRLARANQDRADAAEARVKHLEGALRDNEQAWTTCNAQRDRAEGAVAEQRELRKHLEAELADALRTAEVWRHFVEVRDNQLNGVLAFCGRIEAIYMGKAPSWVTSIRQEIARHQQEPTEQEG